MGGTGRARRVNVDKTDCIIEHLLSVAFGCPRPRDSWSSLSSLGTRPDWDTAVREARAQTLTAASCPARPPDAVGQGCGFALYAGRVFVVMNSMFRKPERELPGLSP